MVMFATVTLSVVVAVGYLAFKVSDDSLPLPLGIALYVSVCLALARSVLRTGLRVVVWLWSVPVRPASAGAGAVLMGEFSSPLAALVAAPGKAADAALARFVHWAVDRAYAHAQRSRTEDRGYPGHYARPVVAPAPAGDEGKEAEEGKAVMRDSLRHFLLFNAILLFLVLPCLATAVQFGYDAIASVLSFVVVMASMAAILLTNAANRVHRTGRFLCILWKQGEVSRERQLAMYVASVGQEAKIDILDSMADQVVKVFALILVVGLIIVNSASKKYLTAVSAGIVAACLLFRSRTLFTRCCRPRSMPRAGYYDGTRLREPLVVLLARTLATVTGLVCLAYLDLSEVNTNGASAARVLDLIAQSNGTDRGLLVPLTCAYLAAYLSADVAFVAVRNTPPCGVRGPCTAALPPTCHRWANTVATLLAHCYGIGAAR
ncbi:hypothetical protein H9P43_008716 [Blastocladiella emersonii ATCC 22665]|nr:hypothetical protein H9P43_008716 [Blastocladiella emersonii ATCC 22665]